jgi:hypothetical protein
MSTYGVLWQNLEFCLIIGYSRLSGSYGKGRSEQDGSLARYNLVDNEYTVIFQ